MKKPMHRSTRQTLYELVWSEPRTSLAKRLGISDVGISKVCRRAAIPLPEPGYWAKRRAGRRTVKAPLPLRGPGMPEDVYIGGNRYSRYDVPSDQQIETMTLVLPTFSDGIAELRERVCMSVGKVTVPKSLARLHRLIASLLAEDERRREKQRDAPYTLSWNEPRFNSPLQRRRLQILNCTAKCTERLRQ